MVTKRSNKYVIKGIGNENVCVEHCNTRKLGSIECQMLKNERCS